MCCELRRAGRDVCGRVSARGRLFSYCLDFDRGIGQSRVDPCAAKGFRRNARRLPFHQIDGQTVPLRQRVTSMRSPSIRMSCPTGSCRAVPTMTRVCATR